MSRNKLKIYNFFSSLSSHSFILHKLFEVVIEFEIYENLLQTLIFIFFFSFHFWEMRDELVVLNNIVTKYV